MSLLLATKAANVSMCRVPCPPFSPWAVSIRMASRRNTATSARPTSKEASLHPARSSRLRPGGGINREGVSGTSYATAIVSGVVALLLHLARSRGIAIRPPDLREILLKTSLDCTHLRVPECDRLLAGRLNIEGVVQMLLAQGQRPVPKRLRNQSLRGFVLTQPTASGLPRAYQ